MMVYRFADDKNGINTMCKYFEICCTIIAPTPSSALSHSEEHLFESE